MYNGIQLASGFKTNAQSPTDVKIIAFTISDRNSIPGIERYKGMIVTVQDSDGMGTLATYILSAQSGFTVNNGDWVVFGGSTITFIDNEIVSGSGTTWVLANVPIPGSEHIYGGGSRLYPSPASPADYTISGATITTTNSYGSDGLLADYRI